MDIRVVCIGTELLIGHTLNSNLSFVGETLEKSGYCLAREVCIPDEPTVMREVFKSELNACEVLILVGGLGPTRDDLTRTVAADVLAAELEFRPELYDRIAGFLSCRGVKLPHQAMSTQAMVPRGATALINANGTAPGLWCPYGAKVVILLPGPPRELQPMFADQVLPRLVAWGRPEIVRRSLTVCGVAESLVEERVDAVLAAFPTIEPAYCARPSLVDIRLSAKPGQLPELEVALEALYREFADQALERGVVDIVSSIATVLVENHWRLAVAESCTGGALGAELSFYPGASGWFDGGFITYANQCKCDWLGVAPETIGTHGAVSEETAREMVVGLLARTGGDCGVAITGIAGPGGGSREKPVGLVYVAIAVTGEIRVVRNVYPGNRETVRSRACATALVELRSALNRKRRC